MGRYPVAGFFNWQCRCKRQLEFRWRPRRIHVRSYGSCFIEWMRSGHVQADLGAIWPSAGSSERCRPRRAAAGRRRCSRGSRCSRKLLGVSRRARSCAFAKSDRSVTSHCSMVRPEAGARQGRACSLESSKLVDFEFPEGSFFKEARYEGRQTGLPLRGISRLLAMAGSDRMRVHGQSTLRIPEGRRFPERGCSSRRWTGV